MKTWALALALFLLAGAGCGYRVVGRDTPGATGDHPLWIAPVEDDSDEPLFGQRFAAALSRQAVDRAGVRLVRRNEAPHHLKVQVAQVEQKGAAYVVGDIARVYTLTGTATAYLTRPDGELIWKASGLRGYREFPAGDDVNQTEANKDVAEEQLAGDLAGEVLRRVGLVLSGVAP